MSSFDFDSSFEGDSDVERRKRRRLDLTTPPATGLGRCVHGGGGGSSSGGGSSCGVRGRGRETFNAEHRRAVAEAARHNSDALSVYDRHKLLVNTYVLSRPGAVLCRDTSRDRTDWHVIRDNHRFLWSPGDAVSDWSQRLAKRYYDKLFREYCLCDLTYYRLNKVALRWRTQQEVVDGKGQFCCGNKHCSSAPASSSSTRASSASTPAGGGGGDRLRSWEVNFSYEEHGERRSCLVKLRLCVECSRKLNYGRRRREVTRPSKATSRRRRKSPHSRNTVAVSDECSDTTAASEATAATAAATATGEEHDIWRRPAPVTEQKSKEQEMDEFLSELFF